MENPAGLVGSKERFTLIGALSSVYFYFLLQTPVLSPSPFLGVLKVFLAISSKE